MKKLILLLFIPLVFACSDDSNSTNEVELQIGDIHEGGIIFYIDSSGQSGLVAATQDLGGMNWGEAKGLESDDWYLPSIIQLGEMYNTIGQGANNIGEFADGTYWSGSYTGNNPVHVSIFNFANGTASNGWNPVLNLRVRFISQF